jgi:hypothetical protein
MVCQVFYHKYYYIIIIILTIIIIIRRQIEKGSVFWFPMNKALSMVVEKTPEEIFRSEVSTSLSKVESLLSGKVGGLQVELGVLLEQLAQILQSTTEGDDEKAFAFFSKKSLGSRMRSAGASLALSETSQNVRLVSICFQRRRLFLDVISIKNLAMIPDDMKHVGCLVMTDSLGTISIHNHDVRDGIVHFAAGEHDQHNLICEDAESGDSREIRLQIVQDKSKDKHKPKDYTFIAFVDLTIAELIQGDGLIIEKLCLIDDGETETEITIVFHISSELIFEEEDYDLISAM